MKNLYYRLLAGITVALLPALEAVAGSIRIDDFRNTNGAAGKDITSVIQKQTNTLQYALDLVFMIFTIGGVIISGICMFILWRASKDPDRERPMSAVVGFFMGGGLTIVGLMVGFFANTLAA